MPFLVHIRLFSQVLRGLIKPMRYIIKDSRIIDGSGKPAYKADLVIEDDRILKIGETEGLSGELIDAEGLTVCPGFIDTHSHTEVAAFEPSLAHQRIVQGVTTEIVGHCGPTPAPCHKDRLPLLRRIYFDLTGLGAEFDWTWSDFAGWLDALEKTRPSTNYACMVGHGTIRACVMGEEAGTATDAQIKEMCALLDQALSQGAIGLGMGIQFFPGAGADKREMTALAKVVKSHDAIIAVHRRNEDVRAVESIDEMLEIAEITGVKMNLSHVKVMGKDNWGKSRTIFEHIERSRAKGAHVYLDAYPWTGGFTQLYKMLDPAIWKDGPEAMKRLLSDPAKRKEIVRQTQEGLSGTMMTADGGADGIKVIQIPDPAYDKKSLGQISRETGIEPAEIAIRLIERFGNDISMFPFYQKQEELDEIMMYPDTLVMSDAVPSFTYPHPRHMGTFSLYLDRYVKQLKRLSLEQAIERVTSRPAALYGLGKRGLIREGMKADLVLFDWENFRNTTDYEHPLAVTEAIKLVFLGGEIAARNGVYTGNGRGEIIRA